MLVAIATIKTKVFIVLVPFSFFMAAEILEGLGLTPNEAKIYEALLNLGTSSVEEVSLESNVHRRNAYDSVEKLIRKGLATEEFVSNRRYVRAVNPTRLLDIVAEKESAVRAVLPELVEKFNRKPRKEEAVIYRGLEGFKNYLNDILEVNEPAFFLGAKAFWLDPRLKYFLPKFDRQRIKQGIHFRHVFDFEIKSMAGEILKLKMNEFKFFPPEFSTATAIDIFGDHVVTFYGVEPGYLGDQPVQFTVISRKIADGYRTYFDFMWKSLGRARKVN